MGEPAKPESLWAKYVKERLRAECIESDYGFLTFQLVPEGECVICDFFVAPEQRKQGHARHLFERLCRIAREQKCSEIKGYIYPEIPGAEEVLVIALHEGFRLRRSTDGGITVSMEVTHNG